MNKRKLAALGAAVVLVVSVSGCGGPDRPSVDDVKSSIAAKKDLLTLGTQLDNLRSQLEAAGAETEVVDEITQCVAEALEGSKLSNKALKALVEGDESAKVDDDDEEAVGVAATSAATCVTDGTAKVTAALAAAGGAP